MNDFSGPVFAPGDEVCEPGGADRNRIAHAALHDAMRPWSTGGAFANFLGVGDTGHDRVRSAYPPAGFARLTELKTVYDPRSLFRVKHNIPPR
ncbi:MULTISPECIES: BBE domain-containing protein [Thermomonosporaceae]|uniref:BBE domain-containing protein n=1 Tax=Thermomonosporaceae TaxID=2012 RepID=UPI00255B23FE|nr:MULTISPECIES: BBE domain-containing protein [Thermomonosporaceae]MDL4775162.1 BBE domain-containing protein [Actinomadura xylanilytica]